MAASMCSTCLRNSYTKLLNRVAFKTTRNVSLSSACRIHTHTPSVHGPGSASTLLKFRGSFRQPVQFYSSQSTTDQNEDQKEDIAEEGAEEQEEYHTIMKGTERGKGPSSSHEFQAETRKLLDIVARSLYSEKEVFIRELVSNGSDALEKLRYMQMTDAEISDPDLPLEIDIEVDASKKTFTIQDTGIGMTKEEMIEHLGTIAKSGSKAFLSELSKASEASAKSSIIGQFGVGFYSSFMVSDKVEVFSKSYKPGSVGHKWTSDGQGKFEISEAENVQRGTKIVLHLKMDSHEFCQEDVIKDVTKKYSNFVGAPIYVGGKKANTIQPLWMLDPKDVTEDMHEEFYRFISKSYDRPKYTLQYKADAPLNIRALFYVPDAPMAWEMSRELDAGVMLYSRKVMIMNQAKGVMPKWLRFLRGVVDSEDIPLNLSRELLQDSALIRKLRTVLTNRLVRYFLEQAKKDPEKYKEFYKDYGMYFIEGILNTQDQQEREDIARLLRFESSTKHPGETTSLSEYAERMEAGARTIYYFHAPSRELAETSPYFEAVKEKGHEVLFCFNPYDELVLLTLQQFDKKNLRSIETEMAADQTGTDKIDSSDADSLKQEEADALISWITARMGQKIVKAKITNRLVSHPAVISVMEMGAARHLLKTSLLGRSDEDKYRLLQATLEINPKHPIIRKLSTLKDSNPDLANLLADQIFDNALVAAGLVDDPRSMLGRLNQLLEKALEKH
ncbi:heat shock protein 75 kDa, mitochondrial-like isoform X2 [Lingula anatina]|uniref:Heat shock protein 75 kDa, mitochondrial n=1 Tax=Lingula anatina TaxID=7574 RepID=A0A1S3K3R1_LINAN|nr:heat shock protein 75 kDa, mitochondrial-like isoform X2 [Lingula anatina]|eukprot:XP_013417162.1 heat shock protein 75 kDa, mitochondrial-like isoform X2 [Lingula anatina]